MKFEEALTLMRKGKIVTSPLGTKYKMVHTQVYRKNDGGWHISILDINSALDVEWEEYKEHVVYHTLGEAITHVVNGGKARNKDWTVYSYMYLDHGLVVYNNNTPFAVTKGCDDKVWELLP